MAALTAKRRKSLPASAYVYKPGTKVGGKRGRYPIDTPARARSALARAASSKNRGSYSTVAKAVKKRYGSRVASVGGPRGTTSRPGYKRRRRSRRRK